MAYKHYNKLEQVVIQPEVLAKKLLARQIEQSKHSLPQFTSAQTQTQTQTQAQEIAQHLITHYESRIASLLNHIPNNTASQASLEAIAQTLQKDNPETPLKECFAQITDLLEITKDKLIIQHLIKINEEIITQETMCRALDPSQTSQWMGKIKSYKELTGNPQIARFIKKTEERITKDIQTLNPSIHSIRSIPTVSASNQPQVENIPKHLIPLVENLHNTLKHSPNIPKNPLLKAAKLMLLAVPQSWIQKKEIFEKGKENLNKGQKRIINATHSFDPFQKVIEKVIETEKAPNLA